MYHHLSCEFPVERYLGDDSPPAARRCWAMLLRALGEPRPTSLPWWVEAAFPADGHCVGLSSDAALSDLIGTLRASRALDLLLQLADQCRLGRQTIASVLDFFQTAAREGRWVLAVESAS